MKPNPVGWFEIYVKDMARARRFYESVLDGKLEKLETGDLDMWAFPMAGEGYGAPGALVKFPGYDASGNGIVIYFSCEDCAVEESRVAPAGGKVFRPKTSIGQYGFISLVHDTEGNLIGLHSLQ